MASHFPLCGWQASRRASARIRRVVWICISTILMQSAPRMKDHERRLLSWRAWRALAFWRETGLAAFRSHPAKNPAPTFSTTCAKRHPNPQTRPSSMEAERTGPHAPANTHMNNPNEPRTPSEAKINTNRENAKKSTGPRTAEGKAASSRNRLLHSRPARQQTYPPRRGSRRVPFPPRRPLGPLPARRRQRREPGPAHRRRPVPPRPCLLHGGRHLPRPLPRRGRQGRAPPRPVRHQKRLRRTGRQTGAASTHPARRARPPGSRFQRRLRGSQLLHQTRPLRNQHRALHRPLPPPVENVSGSPRRLHPQVGQAVPPAETDPPELGQAASPAEAATPSKSTNYHSNPKNGGIAKFSAAAMLLLLHALLHAVPELIAALAGLANLTGPHHPEPSTGARSAP